MLRQNNFWARYHVYGLLVIAFLGMGVFLISGCDGKKSEPAASSQPTSSVVYTTFYPTKYFTERIAGGKVRVINPCPADADPAGWMPDEQTLAAYQNAVLIIINGASFEKWIAKTNLPLSRTVDTSKPLEKDFITLERKVAHSHGPAGEHAHEGIDGHTWLDPGNTKVQALEIKKALTKTFPQHTSSFEEGYIKLIEDLEALDRRLKKVSAQIGERQLLSNHPAYNYLARTYGWRMKVFYLEPEEATDQEELDRLRDFLKDHPAEHLLWEAEPSEEIAQKMYNEFGLRSIVYSPCETMESEPLEQGEDFLTVMNRNVDRLRQAFTD